MLFLGGDFLRLSELQPNQSAIVHYIDNRSNIKRRLEDLGIISGTLITCTTKSPLGDPSAYRVRQTIIALRKQDARHIIIGEVSPWIK